MQKLYNQVLLIDDDVSLNRVVAHQLKKMDFEVTTATDAETGLEIFRQQSPEIVITDLQLPGMSGMELLSAIRRRDKEVIILIITAFGTVENAIEASKLGADDYLTKPFGKESLRFTLEKAIRLRKLQTENRQLRGELFQQYDFSNIIGKSSAMEAVLKLTGRVAESDATVLIQGESGTGKELIARALHYNSLRKDQPFITVNCPSIPANLMESELFGHVRGAFTGALKDRKGKFQLADQGTIFLDEIGDLPADLQARLLRVLQEQEIERIGESKPIKVDTRVVAATNKNLEERVTAGDFREDLYYRLNVVTIFLPPLRERKADIPFLVDHFLKKYNKKQAYQVSPAALESLVAYDWPGNVRELENAIERATVISPEPVITSEYLMPLKSKDSDKPVKPAQPHTLEQIEREAIQQALDSAGGNQTRASKLLDIPRHVLIYRMKKLGIG